MEKINHASRLVGTWLKNHRPIPREPHEYTTLGDALVALRKTSGLTQAVVATRLNVTPSYLARVEADTPGMGFQVDTLLLVRELAKNCCLPRMVLYLDSLHKRQMALPRKGPRKTDPTNPTARVRTRAEINE